jgi:hypothetical protein
MALKARLDPCNDAMSSHGGDGSADPQRMTLLERSTRRSRALVADAWEQVSVRLAADMEIYDVTMRLARARLAIVTSGVLTVQAWKTHRHIPFLSIQPDQTGTENG